MPDRGASGSTPLAPEELPPGTNVLIAGPALTGKRRLLFDMLGETPDRAGVVVTTKQSADRLRDEFAEGRDLSEWNLAVVDCVTKQRAVTPVVEDSRVEYVSSAGDLTGIGIATSGWMQELYHDEDRSQARVGFHTLSTLLMYADLRRVYQFVHVIAGRAASSGFSGVFTIDTVADDAETIARLGQLFEGLIEVRDEPRRLRVRGVDVGPREWTEF